MKIEKVLSRGQGKDAQVLLVLVSTPGPPLRDDDVWVAIGRTDPVEIIAQFGWEWIESARSLSTNDLDRLDPAREGGTTPFGLDRESDRSYWLARFDFTDHPNLHGWWFRWAQEPNRPELEKLNVTAWRSHLKRAPDSNGVDTDTFEPQPGSVTGSFALSDVVVQPLFELGVLFVHGIGDHGVRETLVRWAEPIVKLWRDRGVGVEKESASAIPDHERQRVAQWAVAKQLRNRAPIDGISEAIVGFDTLTAIAGDSAPKPPLVRLASGPPVTCCVATRTEQTLFSDPTNTQPSATLLRLSALDTGAVLRESHVLFAEAYWTRETFPPTWSELRYWLTTAMPIAVWSRLQRLVWTRGSEILGFARDARDRRNAFEFFRVGVSWLIWLAQLAVLPVAYVAGTLAAQFAFGVISLFRVLPVPWLQRAIRTVVTTLLGTLGQSFALQTSPVRRAAIVAAVTDRLNWISARCGQVVVIAHSQGAEVTRRVFQDSRRDNVARWYTFGSGIAPLTMLHPRSLDAQTSRRVVAASKVVTVIAGLLLVALVIDTIPGVGLEIGDRLARALPGLGWPTLIFANVLILLAVLVGGEFGPEAKLNMRASLLPRWRDVYASEDPVPGGSFIARYKEKLGKYKAGERRIYNTRLSFLDHTSYWQNIEEFVAPIALDLLQLMGMGGHDAQEKAALDRASRRRDRRTWWNLMVWVPALAACVASGLWTAFGPAHRAIVWAEQVRGVWSQGAGVSKRLDLLWSNGFFGQLITDLWLPLVSLPLLVAWWGVNQRLRRRSEDALIHELAAAARSPRP